MMIKEYDAEGVTNMIGDPLEVHNSMDEDEGRIVRTVGLSVIEPPVRMRMEGSKLVIEINIPGIRSDEMSVLLKENRFSVSAERKEIRETRRDDFFGSERMMRFYKASEILPARIIPEKAKVSYENGILRIEAPVDDEGGERIGQSSGGTGE